MDGARLGVGCNRVPEQPRPVCGFAGKPLQQPVSVVGASGVALLGAARLRPALAVFVQQRGAAVEPGRRFGHLDRRARDLDALTVAGLPLATLNTAKQHHNADAMADVPSGDIVAYGDVTRSTALGYARSDERTHREVGFDDDGFHAFVAPGDTVYAFTRVLEAEDDGNPDAGTVRFEHVAFNQRDEPVYSGIRTAEIRKRSA